MQAENQNALCLARRTCRRVSCLLAASVVVSLNCVQAQQQADWPTIENERFRIELRSQTPQQMMAFYEARGFPQPALDEVKQVCFTTISILNKSNTVLWLDLNDWSFSSPAGDVRRLDRNWWNQRWEQLGLSMANRATFRWTLLPELRDLQPDEPVGGNIILPVTDGPVRISARLATGEDRGGQEHRMHFDNIRCPREEPVP